MRLKGENRRRANDAMETLAFFGDLDGNEPLDAAGVETTIVDLLAHIKHLCDRENIEFSEVDRIATMHYEAER